jgi:hypothetical protein
MPALVRWVGVPLVLATAAIGFMHTRAGQAMLGDSCPFGGDVAQVSPQVRDERRATATARLRGAGQAATRPAAGFVLGVTTRADVVGEAERLGLACAAGQDRVGLSCDDAATALHLAADFSADGRLVSLSRMRTLADADRAAATMADAAEVIGGAVGDPSRRTGGDAAYLAAGRLRQARVEYRRENYYATVSATNLGDRYVVSEVFRGL